MRLGFLLVPSILVLIVLAAACGDDDDAVVQPTPTTAAGFGDAPVLGTHVTALYPQHGAAIRQAETRSPDPQSPQPPCFDADFTGLAKQGLWYRVLLDGVEVTVDLTWLASTNETPIIHAKGCYATPEGLAPGRHSMQVRVQDPDVPGATPVEVVTWAFDVLP